MFGSEVLDAAAIGAGAALLGGIIAGILAYLTNRANILAKRSELAFEKRLDALREIYSQMSEYNSSVESLYAAYGMLGFEELHGEVLEKDYNDMEDTTIGAYIYGASSFMKVYYKNRVYFTPTLDRLIKEYIDNIVYSADIADQWFDENHFSGRLSNSMNLKNQHTEKIITEIHKFIGFK